MAKRKWTGIITIDLRSMGEAEAGRPPEFKKGDQVIVWKKKRWDKDGFWDGKTYDYHYTCKEGGKLVRHYKLCLEGQSDE